MLLPVPTPLTCVAERNEPLDSSTPLDRSHGNSDIDGSDGQYEDAIDELPLLLPTVAQTPAMVAAAAAKIADQTHSNTPTLTVVVTNTRRHDGYQHRLPKHDRGDQGRCHGNDGSPSRDRGS